MSVTNNLLCIGRDLCDRLVLTITTSPGEKAGKEGWKVRDGRICRPCSMETGIFRLLGYSDAGRKLALQKSAQKPSLGAWAVEAGQVGGGGDLKNPRWFSAPFCSAHGC